MVNCIVCLSPNVVEFLDLGKTALANKFLTKQELTLPEEVHPLRVGRCGRCSHVQLTVRVPPPAMFDDYLYVSSFSATLESHLTGVARMLVDRLRLGPSDLAVDIGSNDGTLLSGYLPSKVRVLGVDPAKNLASLAAEKGVPTNVAYFSEATARAILRESGPASVITGTNCFPHIPGLHDFMRGVDVLLKPGGTFMIEAHYLADMFEQGAFDTVYHEHVSYWALGPMTRLFSMFGMRPVRVERLPIHHGQLRVFVQRESEAKPDDTVQALLNYEQEQRLSSKEACAEFAGTARRIKIDLRAALNEISARGGTVAGYGAPAKGSTLLSYLELGPRQIPYIADRSSLKQGRYTPGTHIPIVPPDRIMRDRPAYVLILAWNFADEIMGQLSGYRSKGGKFILPVPVVRIV